MEIRCKERFKVEKECFVLGPFLIHGNYAEGEFDVPLITTEEPLILSINRGRSATYLVGGIGVEILKDEMTRAPLVETNSHDSALRLASYIKTHFNELVVVADTTTRFGKIRSLDPRVYNSDIYLRIGMFCGDAAGHNMVELASIAIVEYLKNLPEFKGCISRYAVSSNYCTDKKASLVNFQEGRGKWVKARAIIPGKIVREKLKTTPRRITQLNYKKNVCGSRLACAYGGQNSHYANIIAAIFQAAGQDVANVVEGSLGTTTAKCNSNGDLKFGIEMPCLICGTIGGGTRFPYARENLKKMGCVEGGNPPGANAKKFAEIIAAVVLAGELSTMAALTTGGEFIKPHLELERRVK